MELNLNAVRTAGLSTVARASSEPAHSAPATGQRWTTLTIWHRPDSRRSYLAEVYGGTTFPHEHNRRRRRVFATVAECFEFFEPGRLADEARAVALAWLKRHAIADPLAPPARTPVRDDAQVTIPAAGGVGYTGTFDGLYGLRGALHWLYPDLGAPLAAYTIAERKRFFERDFGIPTRSTSHTLASEAGGEPLPSWCKAFIGSLMFFDRDDFHRTGGRNVG